MRCRLVPRPTRPRAWLLASALLLVSGCSRTPPAPLQDAYRQPVQENLSPRDLSYQNGVATLTLRARYDIEAHVMSTHAYSDDLAEVAPVDFALAWGMAATASVQQSLSVRQSGRWYWFQGDETVSAARAAQLGRDMANVHLVPDDEAVRRELLAVPRGATVRLQGFLVDIQHPRYGVRRTSMTRTDTGAGSCEILLVEKVEVIRAP